MPAITLSSPLLRLTVLPEIGGGIADFSVKGPTGFHYPIMRRAAAGEVSASMLGSFVMAPWVNRIRDAKFAWGGRERVLLANTADGMAQHGDVRKRAWKVTGQSASSVSLEFDSRVLATRPTDPPSNWPWAYVCRQTMMLESRGEGEGVLTIDLSVENVDREAFPAGCGLHPYFMRRLWDDRDVVEVQATCHGRYPLERGCAAGAARADALVEHLSRGGMLPGEPIDAVLGGFAGEAEMRWPSSGVSLRMSCSASLGHLVVFFPHARAGVGAGEGTPLSFIAVEPQSHVNDALNLVASGVCDAASAGVRVLEPGERLETRTTMSVRVE